MFSVKLYTEYTESSPWVWILPA